MARFELVDKKKIKYFVGKECYIVRGTLTLDDVMNINKSILGVVLIFENTKGQNSEVIKKLSHPKITISVMGGLNYLNREKYNNQYYIPYTLFTPNELSTIIKRFETIERKINYTWTDMEKAIFVYKTLVEHMKYEKIAASKDDPKEDYTGNLRTLIYSKGVCRGFSLVYKEAMDRLGIECLYQNKTGCHCWNALRIDGQYYLVDLTWDICKKKDNKCMFEYFGSKSGEEFYKHEYHDIKDDKNEIELPATTIRKERIRNIVVNLSESKYTYSGIMSEYRNSKGEEFSYYMFKNFGSYKLYIVEYNNKLGYFYCRHDDDITKYLDNNFLNIVSLSYNHNVNRESFDYLNGRIASYERDDKSSFVVLKGNKVFDDKISDFCIIETASVDGKKRLRRVTVLSENNLTEKSDNYKYDNYIANWLLGRDRIVKKVERFNGYVGFIKNRDKVYNICYNQSFEHNRLNILNRN